MKKIGFIDHSIDEWHANNYPRLIRESRLADAFSVHLAWEKVAAEGKKDLASWCAEQNVTAADSIEQVVAECDAIVVLAPDHPESHEELADLALQSGKPVYIDKPFAPSLAAAQRLFQKARKHATPLMSCSALRFGSALEDALKQSQSPIRFAAARGGGSSFAEYAIHQIEMVVMALGGGATAVMHAGNAEADLLLIDYADGRRGCINLIDRAPYQISLRSAASEGHPAQTAVIDTMNDFFPRFIDALLTFLGNGKALAPEAETLEIIAILETATIARAQPEQWHKLVTA